MKEAALDVYMLYACWFSVFDRLASVEGDRQAGMEYRAHATRIPNRYQAQTCLCPLLLDKKRGASAAAAAVAVDKWARRPLFLSLFFFLFRHACAGEGAESDRVANAPEEQKPLALLSILELSFRTAAFNDVVLQR